MKTIDTDNSDDREKQVIKKAILDFYHEGHVQSNPEL